MHKIFALSSCITNLSFFFKDNLIKKPKHLQVYVAWKLSSPLLALKEDLFRITICCPFSGTVCLLWLTLFLDRAASEVGNNF